MNHPAKDDLFRIRSLHAQPCQQFLPCRMRGRLKCSCDRRSVAACPNDISSGPTAESQPQCVNHDGFSRTSLTREQVQPRMKFHGQFLDDGIVMDVNFVQHQSSPCPNVFLRQPPPAQRTIADDTPESSNRKHAEPFTRWIKNPDLTRRAIDGIYWAMLGSRNDCVARFTASKEVDWFQPYSFFFRVIFGNTCRTPVLSHALFC